MLSTIWKKNIKSDTLVSNVLRIDLLVFQVDPQCIIAFTSTFKKEMLQYVTDAPEGPLCTTHLLIMLYLSVMFR